MKVFKKLNNPYSIGYITLGTFFLVWMVFLDTHSLLVHQELNDEIENLNERILDNKFVNFKFFEEDFEVNIFFDYKTLNLIGWQTKDIYQNLSITFLDSVKKNQKLNSNLFILPQQN